MALTPKQKQILDFIEAFLKENGYAPSQHEIAHKFGFRSLGSVQHYMNQLAEKGFLEKSWNARRGVKLLQKENVLPLMGRVAAGRPIEAIEDQSTFEVPPSMLHEKGEHFALLVQGDSMQEDGILDGDYVIIRKQNTAQSGQTVVALIGREGEPPHEATLKRFFKRRDYLELQPANSAYKPILIKKSDALQIQGVFVGLVRMKR